MALRHRLADASYWFYDRWRHKTAFDGAAQPGTATDFSGCEGKKYAVLVTFRRDGTAVPTPVWFGLDEGRFVVSTEARTAKVKRIRRNPRVTVFPSDPRGKPRGGRPRPSLRPHPADLRGRHDRAYQEVTPTAAGQ